MKSIFVENILSLPRRRCEVGNERAGLARCVKNYV